MNRRSFLQLTAFAMAGAPAGRPLAGIFPIVQTPFTDGDKLDTKTLERELRFLDKTGVHGVVWPQLASEYFDLTMAERLEGMEVVASVGRGLKPAVVLGVQRADIPTALQYTRHAEKLKPDAIIALPPRDTRDNQKIFAYYKAIGESSSRPLFVQSIGDMSVDFVLEMARAIPTLRYVKDEAGQTLPRLSEYQSRERDLLKGVFTGAHGKTLLDELSRGSDGTMPASPFADLYVDVWDAWNAGKKHEAMDRFGKLMLLVTQVSAYGTPSLKYLLELRGVFSNHRCRSDASKSTFDPQAQKSLRETFEYLKPYLRAS